MESFGWSENLQTLLSERKFRQFIVFIGEKNWMKDVCQYSSFKGKPNTLIYCEDESEPLAINQVEVKQYLGQEANQIVYFAKELQPEPFAILSGILTAGGTFFLSLPKQPFKQSLFNQYFIDQCIKNESVVVVKQDESKISLEEVFRRKANKLKTKASAKASVEIETKIPTTLKSHCLTDEQAIAASAVCHCFDNKKRNTLVLTADRGRGKTSALAIACAYILASNKRLLTIAVSAPKKQNLAVFFKQLKSSLIQFGQSNQSIEQLLSQVVFYAIDDLIKDPKPVDLLLIDEAAGIPVPLLEKLQQRYIKSVFCSTIHGYEGAGRGFTFKFKQYLNEQKILWRDLHINQPIRWAENCPFEQFTFDTLLLNAEVQQLTTSFINPQNVHFNKQNKQVLINEPAQLKAIFSLLVSAHYQTSVNDLKLLLDNPNIDIFCLESDQCMLAVALMIHESVLDDKVKADVIAGKRRLRDHFTAQSLTQHLGFEQALSFSFYRVMRIAVHPQQQSQGIGTQLLAAIEKYAISQQMSALSTSFGLNKELLSFWHQQGFQITRLGTKKDHASGEYSGLLVKPLVKQSVELIEQVKHEFDQSFCTLVPKLWLDLDVNLFGQIIKQVALTKPSGYDVKTVSDFVEGRRQFLHAIYSIKQVMLVHLHDEFDPDFIPLIDYLLFDIPLTDVYLKHQFNGKKAFQRFAKTLMAKTLTKPS